MWMPALLIAVAAGAAAQSPAPQGALAPLAFLLGHWDAIDPPPGSRGDFSFDAAADGHVILRRNRAHYDATDRAPASDHDDVMVVYVEGDRVAADYFDSEGHVIRYTASLVGTDRVVLVSAARAGEPRYRLSYEASEDGLRGTFEIAAPGAPDAFKEYLKWGARRSAP